MMPLSFAALISGMTTLIATAPNLVVNSELVRHGQGRIPLLQLHAVRLAGFGAGNCLHGICPLLARRRRQRGRQPPSPAAAGRLDLRSTNWPPANSECGCTDGSPLVGQTLDRTSPARVNRAPISLPSTAAARWSSRPPKPKFTPATFCSSICSRRNLRYRRLAATIQLGSIAAVGGLLHRSVARDRHGRGHRAGRLRNWSARLWPRRDLRDHFGLTAIGLRRGAVATEGGLQRGANQR